MTGHQVATAAPADRGPHTSPEDATFRRLLSGTVFDPRTTGSTADPEEDPQQVRRSAHARCRHAMSYLD